MNTRPGPDLTTESTVTQFLRILSYSFIKIKSHLKAMCPRKENTPKPAKMEVKQFPRATINVSLMMLLENLLYEAMTIKPPKLMLREKKI